jgi:copper chaperone
METLKFKTNIKCGGCITTVTPYLNEVAGTDKWEVDTQGPEKVLTVNGDAAALSGEIVKALAKAGYTAEQL